MKKFTNPLDNIKVASPCPADWDEMFGDNRKRHCAMCKLNVYNLSDMTQGEAENFLINSEGRVCVKFYRRADGTVLTKDCPVGWAKIKRKVSRTAKAFVSICAGLFGGIFAFNQFQPNQNVHSENSIKVSAIDSNIPPNKVEDFKDISIPPIPLLPPPQTEQSVSDDDYVGIMGMPILIEQNDKRLNKKKVNSKKIRRR